MINTVEVRDLTETGGSINIVKVSVSPTTGSTSFTGLVDTPTTYVGQATKSLVVNAAEDGVEFVTPAETFLGLTDTPSTYSGQVGKVSAVNATEDGIEFISVGGTGTVTSITAGTGLDGGTITTSGTIDLADTAVTPGSFTNTSLTVDQQGRITAASSGAEPNLDQLQIIYVSKAGNDSNSGLNINEPKLTISAAITLAGTFTPSVTNQFVIQVVDAGQYDEGITMASFVHVSALAATINGHVHLIDDVSIIVHKLMNSDDTEDLLDKDSGSGVCTVRAATMIAVGANQDILKCTSGTVSLGSDFVSVDGGIGMNCKNGATVDFDVTELELSNGAIGIGTKTAGTGSFFNGSLIKATDLTNDCTLLKTRQANDEINIQGGHYVVDTLFDLGGNSTLNAFVNMATGTRLATGTDTVNISNPAADSAFAGDLTLGGDLAISGIEDVGEAIEAASTSGVLTGGEVTINTSTTFDVAAGTGVVIDWTTPSDPHMHQVSWTAFTAESLPDIGTELFTTIMIDETGSIVKSSGAVATPQQRRNSILLQTVIHADFATITSIGSNSTPAYEDIASILDYIEKLGTLNTGNVYLANASANLTVDKAAGISTFPFINRSVDTQDPTNSINSAISPVSSLTRTYRDGSSGYTFEFGNTVIDPEQVDDGSGTLAAVANNKFTIQRLYFFGSNNTTTITYGQAEYSSLAEAEGAVFSENPDLSPQLTANGVFTTAIIIKKGTTDLTNASNVVFLPITGLGSNTSTSVVDHGALLGLTDDDHLQYLLGDGTRAMTGNLNMGSNDITSVGDVDGRDISADGTTLDDLPVANLNSGTGATSSTFWRGDGTWDTPTVGTTEIDDDAVTYAKIQNISATNRILGRITAGAGNTEELTGANVRTIINVEDNADVTDEANVTDALDGATLSAVSPAVDDQILIQDTSDSDVLKTVTVAEVSGIIPINDQTGTTYTLVIGDLGKKVRMANASANVLTVPPNSSVAFAIGTIIFVSQAGAGSTSIDEGAGVTINYPQDAGDKDTLEEQFSACALTKVATDTWDIEGALKK